VRLVLAGGMRFVVIGIVLGSAVGFAVTRYMKDQIAGVSTSDPVTLWAVIALLAMIGLGACYVPSTRATRVDPLVSLRYE
jgi:ABC-type antimicrobial peptide transport system permease subunit